MISRNFVSVALAAVALSLAPHVASAQNGGGTQSATPVYADADVDTPPRLANPTRTARLVADSYPSEMRRSGVAGQAQLQFVVDTTGKVEPESIQVVLASGPAFAIAARSVAPKFEFTPGLANGQRVRTRVILPIQYK